MHRRRAVELSAAIRNIGVDMRPGSMGVTWDDVEETIMNLAEFARVEQLPYGIAHDFRPDRPFFAELKALVETGA